jgi:chorismate mutase
MLPNKETSVVLSNVIMQLLEKLHPDESDLIQQITEIISEILDPIETENRWEKDSPSQWIQCLTITEDLLEFIKRASHHPGVSGLLESVILPAIQDQNLEVRNKGIRCLGLFCLLNVEHAKKHLLLFLQVVKNDREMIKVTALKVTLRGIMVNEI